MERTFGTAPARTPAFAKKVVARAALVDLKESSRFLLNECFRQFGIETVLSLRVGRSVCARKNSRPV